MHKGILNMPLVAPKDNRTLEEKIRAAMKAVYDSRA